jgi:tetratricopeptide (TPR) repeat protein
MATLQPVQNAQYHLAQHYLKKLQQASATIGRGRGNRDHWLNLVRQDWEQIKQWQAWSAAWKESDLERAQLCATFALEISDAIRVRQSISEQFVWVQQALDAAHKLGAGEAERELLFQMCRIQLSMEALDTADQYAHQLIECSQIVKDRLGLARAWYILGATNVIRGAYDSAETYLKKSLEQLEHYYAHYELAVVWKNLGSVAFFRGEYVQAYKYHVQYLEMAIAANQEGMMSVAHLTLSSNLLFLRDYQAAEAHAQQAVVLSRHVGFTRFIPVALLGLAHAEKWLGKFEGACIHYEEALTERSVLAPSSVINGIYGLGQARFRQGNLVKAAIHFDEALRLAREGRILFRVCEVLPDMVILDLTQDKLDDARANLYELVKVAQQLNTPPFKVKAVSTAVILWQYQREYQQAATWAGLLTKYTQYLDPALFDTNIYQELERKLGSERYHEALHQGSTLTLDDVVSEVAKMIAPPSEELLLKVE